MTERKPRRRERQAWQVECIELNSLTKDFGLNRGIFDISLVVNEGETFGFVGTNGAGKTTTIRHIMGFLQPDSGKARIRGMDCWKESAKIKRMVGYIPGEIAFPDDGSGTKFLKRQMEMMDRNDMDYCRYVCEKLQLDTTAPLKRMSKGMKQKTAIAAAFMRQPDILIMDEPTTGLDPLMRDVFLELVKEQQKLGHTIFMSSHIFSELEETCDRVAMIRDGHIVDIAVMDEIHHNKEKVFKIEFKNADSFQAFMALGYEYVNIKQEQNQVTLRVCDARIGQLVNDLSKLDVLFFKEIKPSLEEHFMKFLKEERKNDK